MSAPPRRSALHLFRIASLVVPSAYAWFVASSRATWRFERSELPNAIAGALGPLWVVTTVVLVLRAGNAHVQARHDAALGEHPISFLDRLDVLTASGSAMAWTSALAIAASVWLGWASLALVGLLGTAVLHLVVLWMCARTLGADPIRRDAVSRSFVPSRVVEGDPVVEELRLSGARVPIGFRLFASGRVGSRWATSRYVVEDGGAGGEIVLEREIGPARRGEHRAAPLELWLEDVFGLCRTPRVRAGAACLTVLPRPRAVADIRPVLADAGAERAPRPASLLPTEGMFRLREYQPGDDARRIHWVRSLVAREVVVRMPDEIPPDRPAVDVVLDTFLPGVDALSCDATGELLDALVAVWLGVATALGRAGVRVTLITAAPREEDACLGATRLRWTRMNEPAALRLGARVAWQSALPVSELVADAATIIVSCRIQPLLEGRRTMPWILVPESVWTCFDEVAPEPARLQLPHPMGSADNRASRRRQARRRFDRALREHGTFAGLCVNLAPPRPGCFIARPAASNELRLVELP